MSDETIPYVVDLKPWLRPQNGVLGASSRAESPEIIFWPLFRARQTAK